MENQEGCGSAAESRVRERLFRFERKERLKGRDAIRAVFNRGKRFGCAGAKLFVLKNGLSHNRICFTFSRRFGNAVERNRSRRLGREAFRLLRPRLQGGYDLVLLVFPETKTQPVQAVQTLVSRSEQLQFLLSKAGLLQ